MTTRTPTRTAFLTDAYTCARLRRVAVLSAGFAVKGFQAGAPC
ncbi:hypothetical protein RD149_21685 [Gordonia westfalica]|uniref:Uncharacterized protein n=1 Tax=Gordonia westfalica TaxID=158898 RepID=A0ABU2GZJ1_9ACTN|nr:hypothetical protein [Gordonia westfalica]MDS1116359.1 hypothetical protein [Gordonia westfalica]